MRVLPFLQLFLSLILFSLIIFGLDSFRLLSIPKTGIYFITNPISLGLYRTYQGISRQFYFIFAARFAAQENKALKEQLAAILSDNATLRKSLAETEAQLLQQQKLDPQTYKTISARPIGVENGILKIDKGINDGVKKDLVVIFQDNFVGKVTKVSEKGATVMLASHPESKVGVFSLNKKGKAKGVLIGRFGSDLLFDEILHEETIEVGDLVYSEGTEGYLPRGLVLGQVSEVLSKEHEVFKQAKVKELFDARDFDLVFVIVE